MTIKEIKITELKEYENNPRINDGAVAAVAESIKNFGFKVPIIIDKNNVIVAGHTRRKAAEMLGLDVVPCIIADDLTPAQVKAFRVADNKTAELADWDMEKLNEELNELADIDFDMSAFGFDDEEEASNPYDIPNDEKKSLNDRFIVPPFSVLDGRAGYWLDRKREWRERLTDEGQARGDAKLGSLQNFNFDVADVSILDPVLCEIIVKWFMPANGNKTFDCFAGDTVFGFVSAFCGAEFTGVELRQEQVAFNQQMLDLHALNGTYICDDGRNINKHLKTNSQDLFFSCPPYFDLEVYSDLENDASNKSTYKEFYAILDTAFTNAVKCLKNNRFAVVVAGDVRDKKNGAYYDFLGDIKQTFKRNGLILYNEMVLIDPVGTAAIRAARYMDTRKVAKTHQNILVFYKGETKAIKDEYPTLNFDEVINNASENE